MRKPKPGRLAAPFVVTASLSAGAMAQANPLPEAGPQMRVDQLPGGGCVAFPKNFKCPPPPSTCNPPRPMPVKCPLPDATNPLTVIRRADGTCVERPPRAVPCEPKEVCPPPPQVEVKCPPPPPEVKPTKQRDIMRSADGTCREFFSANCPPGVKCNPPPPRKVPCPPELQPAK